MRRILWAVAAMLCSLDSAARGGEFPFTGYVGTDRAEVASGPGRRFYTTDRLSRGIEVQVFREDEAGWLAIRPPEGSFSWVPADQIETNEGEDVGKAKAATPCWIGTTIERVDEHRSLVTLKAGELVQIIDRRTINDDQGQEQAWLKIAPPAGEFRFIHGRDISREPIPADDPQPTPVVAEPKSIEREIEREPLVPVRSPRETDEAEEEPAPRIRSAGGPITLQDIDAVRQRLGTVRTNLEGLAQASEERSVELAQFRSAIGNVSERPVSSDGFVPRKRKSSEQLQPVPVPSGNLTRNGQPAFSRPKLDPPARLADARPISTSTGAGSRSATAGIASDAVASQLEQLDLDLSLMLSQDRSTWDLAGLRERAEDLVQNGARPADRGTARLLLDKIKQFEETFDVEDYGPVAGGAVAASADEAPPASGSVADPRYDGKGWLKPVISRSKPAAPYALVDADGKPLCFVTPSPGLNINRYVNKQVGVYGRRGYLETLKTPHVTAERVIDLDRQLR